MPDVREIAAVVVAVLLLGMSTLGTVVTASPPRPGTDGNGLSENASATLWSRDADDYLSKTAYHERYGEHRTPLQQLANGTDITFTRPPATAATWTRHDFRELDPGDRNVSVYPPHANLTDGTFVRDAHVTIFAVQPSTRGHVAPGETPLYIAPDGTLRGLVDYRVRVPNDTETGNRSVEWLLVRHEVAAVRLLADGQVLARTNGSRTPVLDYRLDDEGAVTLRIEARIRVRLTKTVTTDRRSIGTDSGRSNGTARARSVSPSAPNGTTAARRNGTTNVTRINETVTVVDAIGVEVYNLTAYPYYATYPDGDVGVAIFQSRPWQGYRLTDDDTHRVRGVWRFYTARDPRWDTLVRATRTGRTRVRSEALPVYVHAYPSRIGPRVEPVRDGPVLLDVWGTTSPSPRGTIGEQVRVGVVTRSYVASYGVAVRTEPFDRDALRVLGIVRGVNATLVEPSRGAERQLRRSNLTVTVVERTPENATLRIELRDNATGEPIVLEEPAREYPIRRDAPPGFITIAGRRVETNASGVAFVTVTQPGLYTARYHPQSWLGREPAYVGDTDVVRWHPLGTVEGWVALLVEVVWQLMPFLVAFYAGWRLLIMLGPDTIFDQP